MSQAVTHGDPLASGNVRHPRDLGLAYGLNVGHVRDLEAVTLWLERRGFARSTILKYRRCASRACRWLQDEAGVVRLAEMTAEDVQGYADWLGGYVSPETGRGLSASMTYASVAVLRTLDEYRVRMLECEPVVRALPEVEGYEAEARRVLTRTEVAALYEAADALDTRASNWGGAGALARAVLALYYGCGLRRAEGVALRIGEVDLVGGRLLVARAKNYHARYVPLSDGVRRDLSAWIGSGAHGEGGARARYGLPPAWCESVLVNRHGRPARGATANELLGVLCERAGVTQVSLHSLRHSIATHLVASGMALEAVGRFLGHRSLNSTLGYVRVAEEMADREMADREMADHEMAERKSQRP